MFTLDKKGEINFFREFFVTKMIPETEVVNFGKLIFNDLIKNKGSIPMTPLREDFIEFPGMMSQYDTTLYEWTYKEPLDLRLNDTIKWSLQIKHFYTYNQNLLFKTKNTARELILKVPTTNCQKIIILFLKNFILKKLYLEYS